MSLEKDIRYLDSGGSVGMDAWCGDTASWNSHVCRHAHPTGLNLADGNFDEVEYHITQSLAFLFVCRDM